MEPKREMRRVEGLGLTLKRQRSSAGAEREKCAFRGCSLRVEDDPEGRFHFCGYKHYEAYHMRRVALIPGFTAVRLRQWREAVRGSGTNGTRDWAPSSMLANGGRVVYRSDTMMVAFMPEDLMVLSVGEEEARWVMSRVLGGVKVAMVKASECTGQSGEWRVSDHKAEAPVAATEWEVLRSSWRLHWGGEGRRPSGKYM